MSGAIRGASSRILQKYPLAHCCSHKLCLTLMDSCDLLSVRKMFDTINEIAGFFHASAKRHALFEKHRETLISKKRVVQRMPQTRWTSRISSLNSVVELFPAIVSALEELQEDSDEGTSNKAESLLVSVTSFSFIVCLRIAESVLSRTAAVSVACKRSTWTYLKQ